MSHWRNEFEQNFFGSNLMPENGSDKVLTIREVKPEELMNTDGKRSHALVCHWKEDALPMVLNKTNCRTISRLLKENDYTKWSGARIQVYVDHNVRAFGEIVDGLRIRNKLPEDAKIKCEACGKLIEAAFNMSVSQLAAYTKKKYKRCLCAECAQAQADGAGKKDGEKA